MFCFFVFCFSFSQGCQGIRLSRSSVACIRFYLKEGEGLGPGGDLNSGCLRVSFWYQC